MANKSNRIEVDLQVMQNDAIVKLENFGKDFNQTVVRLASLLENVTQVTQGTSLAGGLSDQATTPGKTDQGMENVVRYRIGGDNTVSGGVGFFNTPTGSGGGSTGSGITNETLPSQGGPSNSNDVERQFIEVQRRVMGNEQAIPQSFRQALGYLGAGQLNINPASPFSKDTRADDQARIAAQVAEEVAQGTTAPEDAEKRTNTLKWQNRANRANDVIFNYQATKALATNTMGKYSGFFGGVQNITNAGYQTSPNSGTGGILGSSLFSGAFWHGLNESVLQPMISSDFGLNPAYSTGQAQQARQAINSYGWSSGNMGDFLSQTLKENTIHYQLDPQTQMAFLDPMMRWGGWQSFGQLNTVLANISTSAQAAGMNLGQFTQELVQTSQQVAMATGNTPGVVAGQIQNISATTGLAPTAVGNLMNEQNYLTAAAMSGKSFWSIYSGSNSQALLRPALQRYQMGFNMPINELVKNYKNGTPTQKRQARQELSMATLRYMQNPEMYNNISPLQMMHMVEQNGGSVGDVLRHTHILNEIQNLGNQTDKGLEHHIENLMGQFGPHSQGMVRKFEQYAASGGKKTRQDLTHRADMILNHKTPQKRLQASRKIMIELSGDAKKYFQLQNDASHTNTLTDYGRKAIQFVMDPESAVSPKDFEPWKW